MVDTLAEDGVTPAEALEGSDILPAQLACDATRVSYRQVEIVFRNALRLSDDTGIAFRSGQKMHVMSYGMYGYALLSSPSRAHGIDFLAKYSRLLGTVADTDFLRDSDRASYRFEPLLSYNPSDAIYRFALEFAFSAFQTLSRDILGPSFTFSALRAAYPAPAHAKLYRKVFQCPVQFDQIGNDHPPGRLLGQYRARGEYEFGVACTGIVAGVAFAQTDMGQQARDQGRVDQLRIGGLTRLADAEVTRDAA